MPLNLSLQVHFLTFYFHIYTDFKIFSLIPFHTLSCIQKNQKMGPQSNLLSLLVALAAVFAYLYLINPIPQFLINPISQDLINALSPSSAYLAKPLTGNFHRHHKKHPSGGNTDSICDDFPSGIPPPNTNTTSYLCVDRRGCCNFTTVQAAVNAVPDFSVKRTIIWINIGMY